MGWRIVEVATDEYMQLYLNNLLIKRMTEKILINISEIDTLIVQNNRSSISVNLLNALSSSNVNVIFMNAKHEPESFLVPISGHHASLKILEKQILWTNEFKGKNWQSIVRNKISNQSKLLSIRDLPPLSNLENLLSNVQAFDITNREGHAAKVYWHTLFGKDFSRDQDCLNNPVINSMLNYGYAIIRSTVIKSIVKKGLDPRISLFHKSLTNFFALASDIMEPFRPLVDDIVYKNRDTILFNIEIRDTLIGLLESKVKINGAFYYLPMAIDKVIDHLITNEEWLWVDLWE